MRRGEWWLRTGLGIALGLGAVIGAGGCGSLEAYDQSAQALRDLEPEEAEFVRLLNNYRASMGRPPVTATRLLNQVAYDHSLDMGTRRYFSHNSPEGTSPFDRMRAAGYSGGAMAENIAAGNASAAATFEQWRTSAGHNANMLNGAFRAIGIGRASVTGSPYRYYWTNVFGDRVDSSAISGDAGTTTPPPPPPADGGGATGTGRLGDPCTAGAQCASMLCVRVSATSAICSQRCTDDCGCGAGYACVNTSTAGVRVCAPGSNVCGGGGADAGTPSPPPADAGAPARDAGSTSPPPARSDAGTDAGRGGGSSGVTEGGCAVRATGRASGAGELAAIALAALALVRGARRRRRAGTTA